MKLNKKEIVKNHLTWFKEKLIQNGACNDITDDQVKNSCGFKDSFNTYKSAYELGWYLCEQSLKLK